MPYIILVYSLRFWCDLGTYVQTECNGIIFGMLACVWWSECIQIGGVFSMQPLLYDSAVFFLLVSASLRFCFFFSFYPPFLRLFLLRSRRTKKFILQHMHFSPLVLMSCWKTLEFVRTIEYIYKPTMPMASTGGNIRSKENYEQNLQFTPTDFRLRSSTFHFSNALHNIDTATVCFARSINPRLALWSSLFPFFSI